jgi:pre-mRNA-splicing factor SYF2
MSSSQPRYNAVPLPASLGAATHPEAEAVECPPNDSHGTAQSAPRERLAALKARLSSARKQNHEAVVDEDRRKKLGEDGLKAERVQRAYERRREDGNSEEPSELDKQMAMTADEASGKLAKHEKKMKRRNESGWDVFNNEAQYRNYKKKMRHAASEGRAASGEDLVDGGDPDPLAYGQAPPVSQDRVQALVEDMHDAAMRRASFSRRRTFNEEKDVTYINRRNEVYNKKIERAFDPYTYAYARSRP